MKPHPRTQSRQAAHEVRNLLSASPELRVKTALDKIASKHSMKYHTLEVAYHRLKKSSRAEDGRFLVSHETEQVLLAYILAQDAAGYPLSKQSIIEIVQQYANKPAGWNSWRWWTSFKKRNCQFFSQRKAKALRKNRRTPRMVTDTTEFWKWFKQLVRKYKVPEGWILNADETPIKVDPNKCLGQVLITRGSQRADATVPTGGGLVSFIPFVSATGEVWLSLYIIRGNQLKRDRDGLLAFDFPQADPDREPRRSWTRWYTVNSKGFMTQ